jgi:1,4-alpha-glucan branching enzyme
LIQQQSNEAARAQVLIGRDSHVELFGAEPAGFWLPECAYAPGLDSVLQEANARWFVLDAHGLLFGNPQPQRAIYAPCYTPAGPAAFARDRDSSRQVWCAKEGYPGHPAYREFYRDVGFDLPMEHLGPVARGIRKFSGVKYHRITGQNKTKELYHRGAAERAADTHAAHFLEQRREQFRRLGDFDPIVVAPFDAELFGHWWFEGPRFLETFVRKVATKESGFRLTTPSDYLSANPTQQTIEPAESSWGDKGYLEVWIDQHNSWIYPRLHAAAQRMTKLAAAKKNDSTEQTNRVLKQLARELLLAQSSDWAFLMRSGTAREYATKRTLDHLSRFDQLHDQFVAGRVDEEFLAECESRDNLFPNINWRYYA